MARLAVLHSDPDPAESRADTVARLARDFARTAAAHDREGSFPHENFAALRDAGLLALTVPRAAGGAGEGVAAAAEVIRPIASAEAATALVLSMQYIQHAVIARGRWHAAAKALVARSAVEEGGLINALRVEPELGSPARGGLPATIARATPDGWRISGRKIFSTGVPALRWFALWARTDEDAPRVGMFLVPARAPGIAVIETWDHLGLRASGSHDVVFEDVHVPRDAAADIRLPEEWSGADPHQLHWNAVLLGSLYTGIAEAARDWLAGYLHARAPSNLGAPLASLPRMQAAMGEIEALIQVNRTLLRAEADSYDAGAPPDAVRAGVVKRHATGAAIEAVQAAVALIGNAALTRANPLERHLRDVLCGRIHTPQDDSVVLAAGKAVLAKALAKTAPAEQAADKGEKQ